MTESGEKQLFVAVRTMDRRSLISPTTQAPDLFDFPAHTQDPRLNIESGITGLMRIHHGIVVNTDHRLASPRNEPDVTGYAMYHRHTVDYQEAGKHGSFTPHEVNDMYHDLKEWSTDDETFNETEQRMFRIKAHLFQQVLHLFSGPRLR